MGDMRYDDMSELSADGDASPPEPERPAPKRPAGGLALDPRRTVVVATVVGMIIVAAVLAAVGMPLWMVGAFVVVDSIAILMMSRSLDRTRGR